MNLKLETRNLKLETLLIGVGNPDRGDDGAGVEVVRRLSGRLPAHARAIELGGDATRLLPLFQSARRVVIIDAMRSGEPAGTIRRFDAREAALPARAFCGSSTHTIDVAAAVELGRSLNALPAQIEVIGIEGARFEYEATRSAAVDAAIDRTVAALGDELISSPSPGN